MAKPSRSLHDLHPRVRQLATTFIAAAETQLDCTLLVTCTLRDGEEQDRLYAIGRTAPGRKVTNARAGESYHQYGLAFDVVPLRNGKPVWDDEDPIWQQLGIIGESIGLEWAGRWKNNREFPHFQYTQGLTIAELKTGKWELSHAIV